MNTKLTLTVDKDVIDAAKKYAKSNGRSLSGIIEEYLKSLVQNNSEDSDFEISPLVQSLWGSVKPIPESTDYKEILAEELAKKYLK
ncbi:MAG: DUF6364 family protein [Phaeodactylibacter sp.]|uniref:DUF6364 family protein n=1 Tax=Phaeodactylibacter sp. TaxID=1940289 RepID=UPI0032EBA45B